MTSARGLCGSNRRKNCGSAQRQKHCLRWILGRIKGRRRSFVSWEVWMMMMMMMMMMMTRYLGKKWGLPNGN